MAARKRREEKKAPSNNIVVEMKGDKRNWLEFDRSQMTMRFVKQFDDADGKLSDEELDRIVSIVESDINDADETPPEELNDLNPSQVKVDLMMYIRTALNNRNAQRNEDRILELTKKVMIDGEIVVSGEIVQGVDAIFDVDPLDLGIDVDRFLATALNEAVTGLASLGNSMLRG